MSTVAPAARLDSPPEPHSSPVSAGRAESAHDCTRMRSGYQGRRPGPAGLRSPPQRGAVPPAGPIAARALLEAALARAPREHAGLIIVGEGEQVSEIARRARHRSEAACSWHFAVTLHRWCGVALSAARARDIALPRGEEARETGSVAPAARECETTAPHLSPPPGCVPECRVVACRRRVHSLVDIRCGDAPGRRGRPRDCCVGADQVCAGEADVRAHAGEESSAAMVRRDITRRFRSGAFGLIGTGGDQVSSSSAQRPSRDGDAGQPLRRPIRWSQRYAHDTISVPAIDVAWDRVTKR